LFTQFSTSAPEAPFPQASYYTQQPSHPFLQNPQAMAPYDFSAPLPQLQQQQEQHSYIPPQVFLLVTQNLWPLCPSQEFRRKGCSHKFPSQCSRFNRFVEAQYNSVFIASSHFHTLSSSSALHKRRRAVSHTIPVSSAVRYRSTSVCNHSCISYISRFKRCNA
jgi:hypothetical protein